MLRAAFVPMAWIKAEISAEALRTLIAISSFADRTTGECWPSNRVLADTLNRSVRNVQRNIIELQDSGLIAILNGDSKNRIFQIESEEWFQKSPTRRHANHDSSVMVNDPPTMTDESRLTLATMTDLTHNHDRPDAQPCQISHGPNRNTSKNTSKNISGGSAGESDSGKLETSANLAAAHRTDLEPFESETTAQLPVIRNGVAQFKRRAVEIIPTKFNQQTIDKISEVLGISGDEFARCVTQDHADSGFVEWVLKRAQTAKRPIGLAMHLLKTAWRDDWVNPEAEEDQRYAELVQYMETMQS